MSWSLTLINVFFTGIQARLDYLKDVVGSKALYINSLYESDDDDRMAIVDHQKIDPVFGTMADFNALRKATKKMESMSNMHLFQHG